MDRKSETDANVLEEPAFQMFAAALLAASDACMGHARTCGKCYVPIMDEEGNPQYLSEACERGRILLQNYMDLEAQHYRGPGSRRTA